MPLPAIETIQLRCRELCDRLVDLVFPPYCVSADCHRIGIWLCPECLNQVPRVIPPICIRCGDKIEQNDLCARCQVSPLQIERIRSAVYFEGAIREAIHHLKYRKRTVLAKPLGSLMATHWHQHPMPADVIVPVPLHAARLRERGYNQAALLARELAQQIGLPVDEHILSRQRATASQVNLSAAQRKQNVHDAFCCTKDVTGKRVLLIDDVCTTGATLEACAIALCEKGAQSVHALTLARAC